MSDSHKDDHIDDLARPMSSRVFQLFMIGVPDRSLAERLVLFYETGRTEGRRGRTSYMCTSRIYDALKHDVTVREELVRWMWGSLTAEEIFESAAFDHISAVSQAVCNLRKQGIRFAFIRGSEVSLDRLVQLQESLPASPADLSSTQE